MIAPTSSQSPLCSSSAIFLQSALQCFYHHLTPDTLILPQSYLAPLPSMPIDSNQQASSSNQPTLKHYHQHLKQYYHQLMLSITEQQQLQQQHHHQPQIQTVDNGSNIKQNPLISSATAALLLNRIVCGTIDETGTNCDDLMTRSMPSESVMLQHQHHHHHHHHQTQCRTTFDNPNTFIGNRHASVDCSTNYYRNQWLNLNNCEQIDHNNGHRQHIRREEYPQNNNRKLNRSSSINGSSSGPIEYRHRHGSTPTCNQSSSFSSTSSSCLRSAKSSMLPSGDQHQHQQQKQQLGNKTSCCTNINVNRHHRRTSSDQVNVIRNNGSGSTGYVTELVAKFEQRITTTTTTATTTTAARSAAPTTAVNSNASITSIASRQPQFNENQTCSCNRMALVDHSPFTTIQPQSSIIVNNKNMVESNDQENDNGNIIRRINREQEQDDKQQIEPSPNKRLSSIKAVDKTETMTTNTLNISMDHLSPSSTKPVDTKQPNHQQEHAMESGASLLRRPTSTITHKSHHNNSSSSSTRIGIASKLKTNPKSANHIITSSINHLHNQQQQRTNQHNSICCCCCCSQSNPFLLGININELKQCVANNNGKTHCHHCHIRYHNREPRLQSASPFKSSLIKTNGTLKKMENNQNKSSSQSIIMVNKGMTNQMDTNLGESNYFSI
ncbi:hypothetical protein RDWZM_006358 [Blomia tropicalis]|uniref:Uncharacterized protein n=1 Tax=Blomia tropicalis TaxID=40697 RepID=A0A9Q0M6Y4_BLOTA|nr:hypothetical protein RDWZM_006358 [Blomia tropicalis]